MRLYVLDEAMYLMQIRRWELKMAKCPKCSGIIGLRSMDGCYCEEAKAPTTTHPPDRELLPNGDTLFFWQGTEYGALFPVVDTTKWPKWHILPKGWRIMEPHEIVAEEDRWLSAPGEGTKEDPRIYCNRPTSSLGKRCDVDKWPHPMIRKL